MVWLNYLSQPNMNAFLAMLQINIALGMLYVGLKENRYRKKLFNAIVGKYNSKTTLVLQVV